jgi:hypothetical protein
MVRNKESNGEFCGRDESRPTTHQLQKEDSKTDRVEDRETDTKTDDTFFRTATSLNHHKKRRRFLRTYKAGQRPVCINTNVVISLYAGRYVTLVLTSHGVRPCPAGRSVRIIQGFVMKVVSAGRDECGDPRPAHAIRHINWEFSCEASTANEISCETPCSSFRNKGACKQKGRH